MNIVILERNTVGTDVAVDCFEKLGNVEIYPITTCEEEVKERIKDADIVIANKSPLNERTLKDAPNVKLIAEFATGYDNIDIEYCKSKGIKVANVRNYSTAAVAQHTFAMCLYVLEHLSFYDEYVKGGTYGSQPRFSNFDKTFTELDGKIWGIIGMGNIGRSVAKIATAFGCKVIYYSTSGTKRDEGYECVTLDELLTKSDFVSIHCPLNEKTKYLVDKEAFKKMKNTAIILNVARGAVINNEDLYEALTNDEIAGAGLDVLDGEPIRKDNPLGTFMDSNRLIITPHMAWASTEARERCVEEAFLNVEAFLRGEDRNIVV